MFKLETWKLKSPTLDKEIARCKMLLSKFETKQATDCCLEITSCASKYNLQVVREASIDQRQHHIMIAGNLLFLEFVFDVLQSKIISVKLQFPEKNCYVESKSIEDCLLDIVNFHFERLSSAFEYLAQIDSMTTDTLSLFLNIQCLEKDLKNSNLGIIHLDNERLGISIQFFGEGSLFSIDSYSLFLSFKQTLFPCSFLSFTQSTFLNISDSIKTNIGLFCELQNPLVIVEETLDLIKGYADVDAIKQNVSFEVLLNTKNSNTEAWILKSFTLRQVNYLNFVIPALKNQVQYNKSVK